MEIMISAASSRINRPIEKAVLRSCLQWGVMLPTPPARAATRNTEAGRNDAGGERRVHHNGYLTAQEPHRDISYYLVHRYGRIRQHRFNDGLAPAVMEETLNAVSGMC